MSSLHNQTGLGKRALVSPTAQQREKGGGLALSINYNYLYNCHLIDNARISSLQNLLLSILKIIEAFLDLTMKNMYI